MSIDYTYVVGPLLVINLTPRTVSDEIVCCPNKQCEKYWKQTDDNFCPKCGEEVMLHEFEREKMVGCHDFVNSLWNEDINLDREDECLNLFMNPEYAGTKDIAIVVSNITAHNYHVEMDDFRLLKDMDVEGKMEKFKDDNEDYLEEIRQFFGKENVSIEFGICNFTS